jgi:hypothetical protein
MNKKHLALFGIPLLALGLASTALAYSGNGYGQRGSAGSADCLLSTEEREARKSEHEMERIADIAAITGISEIELKEAFANGTSMHDIFEKYDIDGSELRDELRAQATVRMEAHMSELVAEGILTQEEADERIATMAERRDGGMYKGEHGAHDGSGDGNNYGKSEK